MICTPQHNQIFADCMCLFRNQGQRRKARGNEFEKQEQNIYNVYCRQNEELNNRKIPDKDMPCQKSYSRFSLFHRVLHFTIEKWKTIIGPVFSVVHDKYFSIAFLNISFTLFKCIKIVLVNRYAIKTSII